MRILALGLAGVLAALAQTAPDWRKIGSTGVDLMLASPATGPVERVWYAPNGAVLYARTAAGIFQTDDFENWIPAVNPSDPPSMLRASAVRMPEPGAQVIVEANHRSSLWALGRQLSRSEDGGRSWTNLTAYGAQSVVGPGQRSVAVSPIDPDQIAVANDYGVWRSMDGGLSWAGLNQTLPNLAVRRILATPTGAAGMRVVVANLGVLQLPHGAATWEPAPGAALVDEATLTQRYTAMVGADITAFGRSGDAVFIGSRDGRIWISRDGGATFEVTNPTGSTGKVERIYVNAAGSRVVALAALSGTTGPHVLRSTNEGKFWDALDGNLPNTNVYSVTADRASGAVYAATAKGVFYGRADLEGASTNPVNWQNLTERLAQAAATDVALDAAGVQLYIALDGYGVFATAAPHRRNNLQVVNAADFSTRAAAPGSLLSVIGGRVTAASAGSMNYPVLATLFGESQIQVPFEAVGPSVALALQTEAGRVTRDLAVQPVSPAILLLSRDGAPALYDADSGLALDGRNTAHSNARVQIMATGLGRVTPDWPTGMPAPLNSPPAVTASVKVFLDGAPLQVTRATLAPGHVGFYVIEALLPAITNAGTSELYISADGHDSNKVQIVIEQ